MIILPTHTLGGKVVADQLYGARQIVRIFNTFSEGSARISGGYLRDLLTLREPKDIDILVQYTSVRDLQELRMLTHRCGFTLKSTHRTYHDYSNDCGAPNDLVGVVKLQHKMTDLTIDVIFARATPAERIAIFPANSSRVWLEDNRLCYSDDFKQFLVDRELVFTDDAPQEYVDRLRAYYPQNT